MSGLVCVWHDSSCTHAHVYIFSYYTTVQGLLCLFQLKLHVKYFCAVATFCLTSIRIGVPCEVLSYLLCLVSGEPTCASRPLLCSLGCGSLRLVSNPTQLLSCFTWKLLLWEEGRGGGVVWSMYPDSQTSQFIEAIFQSTTSMY